MKKTTKDFLIEFIKASSYDAGSKNKSSYKNQFSLEKMIWFSHSKGFNITKCALKSLCDCKKGVFVLRKNINPLVGILKTKIQG